MAVTKKIQQISPYLGNKIKSTDIFPVASLTGGGGYGTYGTSGIQIYNYTIDTLSTSPVPISIPHLNSISIKSTQLSARDLNTNNLTSLYIESNNLNCIDISSTNILSNTLSSSNILTDSLTSLRIDVNVLSAQSLTADNVSVDTVACNQIETNFILANNINIGGFAAAATYSFILTHTGSPSETIYFIPNFFNTLDIVIQIFALTISGSTIKSDFVLTNTENTEEEIILTIHHHTDAVFRVVVIG